MQPANHPSPRSGTPWTDPSNSLSSFLSSPAPPAGPLRPRVEARPTLATRRPRPPVPNTLFTPS
ncbi:hypothetical protein BU16DRAFT_585326 [Lophium mytilinum]|uniref:Uncharacterized protein n=1 Tax=Lophium mytilinum TaxID=390894 RepID=A0A6A6QG58_9PEZI|nr:hypothetical protein BU16DRAFT_585326 [Lophium mytilinum]